jgi:hypothetical protein
VKLLRRSLPLVAALVLMGLATALALFAADVRAWQGTLVHGDVRFAAVHGRAGLWRSPAILPGDPARVALGLGDGLAYRHALRLFWLSEVGVAQAASGNLTQIQIEAEQDLQALVGQAKTGAERSTAANLLGVMTVLTPAADDASQVATLQRAGDDFRQAIADDPGSYPPKLNLELLLRLLHPDKTRFGEDAHGGFGSGGSVGYGTIGGGF